jgi:hypothetical protein
MAYLEIPDHDREWRITARALAYAIAFLDSLPPHRRDGPLRAAMLERLRANSDPLSLSRLRDDVESRNGQRIEFDNPN